MIIMRGLLLLGLGFVITVGACSPEGKAPKQNTIALVLELAKVHSAGGRVEYDIVERELKTLEDFSELRGKWFSVKQGGGFSVEVYGDKIIQSERFKEAGKPNLRYELKNNVVIPRDYSTFAMISVYYQFEQIITQFNKVTGLKIEDVLGESADIEIMFEPTMTISIAAESITLKNQIKMNAAFVTGTEQFIIAKKSRQEVVPIGLNLQVIAHEFGHLLFDKLYIGKEYKQKAKTDDYDPYQVDFALRGFNEGVADVISFLYTGSANILESSIAMPAVVEARNFAETQEYTKDFEHLGSTCQKSFYCVGSALAFVLYQTYRAMLTAEETGYNRVVFGKDFMAALKKGRIPFEKIIKETSPNFFKPPKKEDKPASDEASTSIEVENNDLYDAKVGVAFILGLIHSFPVRYQPHMCKHATVFGGVHQGFKAVENPCYVSSDNNNNGNGDNPETQNANTNANDNDN